MDFVLFRLMVRLMLAVEVKPVIEEFLKTLGILISSLTTSAGLLERYNYFTGV